MRPQSYAVARLNKIFEPALSVHIYIFLLSGRCCHKLDTGRYYLCIYSCLFRIIISFKVNGIYTQGENIADNSGLRQAFFAYKKYTQENGEEKPIQRIEQFTPEQLFFISYAMVRFYQVPICITNLQPSNQHATTQVNVHTICSIPKYNNVTF